MAGKEKIMDSATDSISFTSIVAGVVLVLVGVLSHVLTDFASLTALIPSVFGFVFIVLGVVARTTGASRPAILSIAVLAVLGIGGSLRGVPDIVALVTGGSPESTVGAVSQGAMIAICLFLLVAVFRFFRDS